MFERIKKYVALKSYINKLGPLLKARYGKLKSYTPKQIKKTISIYGINDYYIGYAYAMFIEKQSLYQNPKEIEGEFDFKSLKQEVGDKFFGGDTNFTANEMLLLTNEVSGGSFGSNPDDGGSSISGYDGNSGDH